jgi:arginyl-tRNA synthetase
VNIQALLSEKVSQALIAAGAPADCEPQVRQSAKVQFGDYQANGVMAVAKKLGMPPRQLAEQVLTHLDLPALPAKPKSPARALSTSSLSLPSWQATLTRR